MKRITKVLIIKGWSVPCYLHATKLGFLASWPICSHSWTKAINYLLSSQVHLVQWRVIRMGRCHSCVFNRSRYHFGRFCHLVAQIALFPLRNHHLPPPFFFFFFCACAGFCCLGPCGNCALGVTPGDTADPGLGELVSEPVAVGDLLASL